MVVKRSESKLKGSAYAALKERIQPVHELPMVISALFYGRSGTGKTTVAATFPKPALILDIKEKGTDSVFDVEGIDVLPVEDWDDVEEVFWMLKKEGGYKTIIIDQVSAMQDLCRDKILAEEEKDKMSLRLFGELSGRMKEWINNYRDLMDEGIHVVFLAHDRTFGNDDSEDDDQAIDPSVGPRVMPSVAASLCGAVKVVACTFIQETYGKRDPKTRQQERSVSYCLRVGANGTYTTKVRTSKKNPVPSVMVDPSYEKIIAMMRNTGEAEQESPAIKSRIKRRSA